jgi:hypothetical protein
MHKLDPELMSIMMGKHVYETNLFIDSGKSQDFIKFYVQQVIDQYGKKQFLPEIRAVLYGSTQLTEQDFLEPSEVEFTLDS